MVPATQIPDVTLFTMTPNYVNRTVLLHARRFLHRSMRQETTDNAHRTTQLQIYMQVVSTGGCFSEPKAVDVTASYQNLWEEQNASQVSKQCQSMIFGCAQ